jgi:hypothetical protein
MEKRNSAASVIVKPLGGSLLLREVFKEDIEKISDFFVRVFAEDEGIKPDLRIKHWTQDLIRLDDDPQRKRFGFLVEKEDTAEIVSALLAIPQIWTYDGIRIPVGRPEPVATDKGYRNRGLVRALFQEFHETSAEYGDLMQAISGIPWFYRQFGYEMAVELAGSRSGFITQVEAAEKEKLAGISVRQAQPEDIPFLAELYGTSASRYLIHCPLDENWWEKELVHKHLDNLEKTGIFLLMSPAGEPVGFFIVSRELSDKGVFIRYVEVKPGENWREYLPYVITESWKFGEKITKETGGEFNRFILGLGSQHPAYQAAAEYIPMARRPYNWYIRVPDLVKFITHISAALERNLARSPFSGFTGTIDFSFYRNGLNLTFQEGRFIKAENTDASVWHKADVCFPDLTFLQLMLGYRSGSELLSMFVDCRISEKFLPVMDALFPKKQSLILPVE